MCKIYFYRQLQISPKPVRNYENRLNSSLEALDGLKTPLIGVKPKIVAWTKQWRFPANISFLGSQTGIIMLITPNN